MVRIPQKAAIQTILQYMKPQQKVFIIDKCHPDDCVGSKAYEGTTDDLLHNYINAKYCAAECRGLTVEDDKVVFTICTQWEKY